MKVAEKAVSNTIYLFLNWVTMTAFSFIYWVIAGKLLLPSEYGMVTTGYQIMFLLGSLANLGLGVAVSKVIPELIASKKFDRIPTVIKFSLKVTLTTASLMAGVLLLLYPFLHQKIGFSLRDLVVISLGIIFVQLSTFFSRIWYGFQNMKKIWINSSISQFVKLATAAILIYLGFSYFGPLVGLTLMYLVSFLLYFSPKFLKNGKYYDTKFLFYKLALPAFVANFFRIVFNNTQYIILSLLKTTQSTGYFSLAFMISVQVAAFVNVITSAIFPLISGLNIGKKKDSQSKLLTLGIRYGLLVSLPAALFIYFFAKPIILIFFRQEYLPSASIFSILLPGVIMFAIGNLILTNLYAIGKSKLYRNINLLVSFVYFSTAISFSYFFGFVGMAFSYLISAFINFITSLYYGRKYFEIRMKKSEIGKIFLSLLVLGLIWKVVDGVNVNFFVKLAIVLLSFFVYPIVLKITKFYSKDDKRVIFIILEKTRLKKLEKIVGLFI